MISRVRRGVAAISVASLLVAGLARQVNAIILSNDVDLSASDFGGFHDCVSEAKRCQVIGAPRLLQPSASGFDIDQLQIKIETQGAMPRPKWVALNVFLYPSLSPAPGSGGPLRLILEDPSGPKDTFGLNDFKGFDDLKTFITDSGYHGELIFTVAASFKSQRELMGADFATITLSGLGQWVAVDLLGDVVDPPPIPIPVVVPPRSIDLALALVRMGVQSENRPVDLGVDGINRPVGFTHIVGLPSPARLQGASLRLLLTPNGPFFTTDYILLDEGVRKVAAGEEGAPVVALSHVLSPPLGVGNRSAAVIDLTDVPLMLSPAVPFPETPDTRRNLLGQLRDGQLNVIVTDDTTVIGSLLTVFLRDP